MNDQIYNKRDITSFEFISEVESLAFKCHKIIDTLENNELDEYKDIAADLKDTLLVIKRLYNIMDLGIVMSKLQGNNIHLQKVKVNRLLSILNNYFEMETE